MKTLVLALASFALLALTASRSAAAPITYQEKKVVDVHSFDNKACGSYSECTSEGEWCILVILSNGSYECREA